MRVAWLVLVVACGGSSEGEVDSSAHAFCVTETNRYRAMTGRAAVERSPELEEFANVGAMVDHGGTPHDHFRDTQGGGIAFAENECPHWNLGMAGGDIQMLVAQCIEAFYAEGPGGGHYENMLGNYGTLGCGLFQDGQSVTIVQDFGR